MAQLKKGTAICLHLPFRYFLLLNF